MESQPTSHEFNLIYDSLDQWSLKSQKLSSSSLWHEYTRMSSKEKSRKEKKSREKNVLFLIVFASLSSANDLCWLGTWSHEFGFGFSSSLASAVIFSLPGQHEREEILFHKRFMLITWDVVLNNLTEFMLKFRFIFAELSFLFSYLLYFSLPSHFHSRPTQSIVSQWQRGGK